MANNRNSYKKWTNEAQGIPWPSPSCSDDNGRYRQNHALMKRYRLTVEDYEGMIWLQDNKCACCGKDFRESSKTKKPAVDHDHNCCEYDQDVRETCGRCVRGIVCATCNHAIGFFEKHGGNVREYLGCYV